MNYETFLKLDEVYNEIIELENLVKLKRKTLVDNYNLPLYKYYRKIYDEKYFSCLDKKYINEMNKSLKENIYVINIKRCVVCGEPTEFTKKYCDKCRLEREKKQNKKARRKYYKEKHFNT